MSITKDSGRQEVIAAQVDFTYDDFGTSGVAEVAIDIPQNAVVVGGVIVIDTAFNSGTSDTLTVGDGGDDDRYAAGVDGQAAALTALTRTGYKYLTQDTVDIKWTGVGAAPSAGAGRLVLEYIVEGRSRFSQG